MEGKELYNNEDEEFDPKSKKDDKDADDFGLPDIEDDADDQDSDLGDPYPENWEEKSEPDTFVFDDSSDDTSSDSSSDEYAYDQGSGDNTDDDYKSSYYDDEYEQKKSPVGWIIFGVLILIAIIVAIFWWINRADPEPVEVTQPVVEQPIRQTEPEPEPEPEPVVEEPIEQPVVQAGVFEINEPTGRYHVIVASSIDKDLVTDYAKKLAQEGMMCNILAPQGNMKFHRLSVADFVGLNDAAIKSEELKHSMGEDVWVIRY